jgi:hypothetical protein
MLLSSRYLLVAAQAVKMTFAADSRVMEHERQNDVGPQEQAG